jgi:hypothetical protein
VEQPILARIYEARAAGLSLPRIARDLNQDGVYTRSGSPWRWEYLRTIVRRTA